MTLGDNIQYLRKVNDITQEELAEKLSVSRQTISLWVKRICGCLHITRRVLEYLKANGFKENVSGEYLSCFEYVYEKDNTTYMEVCIHVDSVGYANLFTPLK